MPSQPLYIQPPFVGRKREQEVYHQLLTSSLSWVYIITGQGGNGKSTLLRQFAAHTPSDRSVITLNFANESLRTDSLKILEALADQVAPNCDAQRYAMFEKTLIEGRNRFSELSRQMSQTILVGDDASLQGASLTMSGADTVLMREQRHQIRALVTRAFYALISTLDRSLVLLLDTCEWLSELEGQEVGQWVMDELLPYLHDKLQQRRHQCSVVIASRTSPGLTVIEKQDQRSLTLPMLDLTITQICGDLKDDYLTDCAKACS